MTPEQRAALDRAKKGSESLRHWSPGRFAANPTKFIPDGRKRIKK